MYLLNCPFKLPTYNFESGPNATAVGSSRSNSFAMLNRIGIVDRYVKLREFDSPAGLMTDTAAGTLTPENGDNATMVVELTIVKSRLDKTV